MIKKVFFMMLVTAFVTATVSAQNAQNVTNLKKSDPLKDYLRPSLTVLYLDRDEALSERLISQMVQNGISGKFNDNSITRNVLKVNGNISEAELTQSLTSDITREIVSKMKQLINFS